MLTVYEHSYCMAAWHFYQMISSEKALHNVMVYQPVIIHLTDGWFVGMSTTSNHYLGLVVQPTNHRVINQVINVLCVISGFHREVYENCSFLDYYAG